MVINRAVRCAFIRIWPRGQLLGSLRGSSATYLRTRRFYHEHQACYAGRGLGHAVPTMACLRCSVCPTGSCKRGGGAWHGRLRSASWIVWLRLNATSGFWCQQARLIERRASVVWGMSVHDRSRRLCSYGVLEPFGHAQPCVAWAASALVASSRLGPFVAARPRWSMVWHSLPSAIEHMYAGGARLRRTYGTSIGRVLFFPRTMQVKRPMTLMA